MFHSSFYGLTDVNCPERDRRLAACPRQATASDDIEYRSSKGPESHVLSGLFSVRCLRFFFVCCLHFFSVRCLCFLRNFPGHGCLLILPEIAAFVNAQMI